LGGSSRATDGNAAAPYNLTARPLELSPLNRALRFYRDAGGLVQALGKAMLYRSRSKLFVKKSAFGHEVFDNVHGVAPAPDGTTWSTSPAKLSGGRMEQGPN
jgi:hypothetical protein